MSKLFFSVAEPPLFTLQQNGHNQNTTLVCSATGGYPPITNISLLKNGQTIASTVGKSTVQVNTADVSPNLNHYGLYICLVDLSGIVLQQSVVLKERGIDIVTVKTLCVLCFKVFFLKFLFLDELQIQLSMNNGPCTMWSVSGVCVNCKKSVCLQVGQLTPMSAH